MDITVIICTYNRAESLARTLESVEGSVLPESTQWELLVVDNNSSDRTRQVVEGFCRQHPGRFRYLFEPRAGKSYGLNAAVREARGTVVAFTDDDVTVEPTWLQNLTASLHGEGCSGVGGRTIPAHPFACPRWLPLKGPFSMSGVLALFDGGDKAGRLDGVPYGVNMAFRKKMFERYGLFRTDLGPSPDPDVPRPNEDAEFGRRLLAGGECLRYEPSAVVYHPVPEDRLTRKYFLAWWFDYGRAAAREKRKSPDVWGIPHFLLSVLRMATSFFVRAVQWWLTFDIQTRFHRKMVVAKIAGEIVETYRQGRRSKNASQASIHETGPGLSTGTR